MPTEEKSANENATKDFNEGVSHFKLSIWVPTEAVGKVIGKKGAVIQHIQRETKTTCSIISVPNGESESMDGPKWSPIVIMGDPTRALAAHDMIEDIVEEIDDAIVEFSLPLHLIPRQYQSHSKYHPSEAVQLLSATTNVRIHIPERREITNAYKSRNRDSHFSSSDMLISLEGEVANIFKAVSEFAVAVSTRNACKNITIPQPDDRCRFIGKEGEDAQRTKAEKDNWRDRENDDDDYAALTYEQYVNVPCSLVGLLLVKRDNDLNVMRQIMRGSKTQALKLPEPVLPNSWTGMENQGNDAHERPTTVSEVESEGTISRKKNEEDVGDNGHRLVETFAIRGSSAASVELAASCLLRIVNGDKIATVLSSISNRKVLVDRFGSKRTGVSTSASSNDKTVSLGVSNCEVVDDKVNDRRDRADGAVSLGKKNQKNTVRVDKSGSASRGRGKGGRERGVNVKKSIKSSN